MREFMPINWPTLFAGFVVTALYYVAASLVFPDDVEDWNDLNAHFDKHHRTVLGAILLCNIALIGGVIALTGPLALTLKNVVITWTFFPVAALGILVKDRRVVMACLVWLILLYPLSVFWP
jgi:hypothetical protein